MKKYLRSAVTGVIIVAWLVMIADTYHRGTIGDFLKAAVVIFAVVAFLEWLRSD